MEFAGMPRAGKTSCIDAVAHFLKSAGFKVHSPTEGASRAPRDLKRNRDLASYNLWTLCYALTTILEATYATDHVVLLDRGPFDAICWFNYLKADGKIDDDARAAVSRFLRIPQVRRVDLVLVLTCNPQIAMEREQHDRLADAEGTVTNLQTLTALSAEYCRSAACYMADFPRICVMDTSESKSIRSPAYRSLTEIFDAMAAEQEAI